MDRTAVTGSLSARVRPRRSITGMSAVLLPFTERDEIDWVGFARHVDATIASGLVPAVNMDTGFGPVLTRAQRLEVLAVAQRRGVPFVAGAHVGDLEGSSFALDAYRAAFDEISAAGGTPIVFPSYGLGALGDDELVHAHEQLARDVDRFYAFELGSMFHPAGRVFSLDVFSALLDQPKLAGLKHSSLDRGFELDRLAVRDLRRPDFAVLTGNDLAIDMVVYGSDYLLGVSTFAPEAFAARDAAWAAGDELRFWALNDTLQYLGQLAFREPVPGYRHDAAMFLALGGRIACDGTHSSSPRRPDSDRSLLEPIAARLAALLTA
jgi:dihydrodipicolinate synthase/N-acetylneuraminate lyase